MERVEGTTMMRWGTTFPWRVYTGAKMMARLHAEVHSKIGVDIPHLRDRLRRGIEESEVVEEDLRGPALERLDSLPDGDFICHGDFHPDNLIMTKTGPVIIDWEFGAKGVPAAGHRKDSGTGGVRHTTGVRYSQSGDRGRAEDIPFHISQGVFQDYGYEVGRSDALAAAGGDELRQLGLPRTPCRSAGLRAAVRIAPTTTVRT